MGEMAFFFPFLFFFLFCRKKKILRYAQQRGMLENELILGSYAIEHVEKMSEEECGQFEDILNEIDPDVYQWVSKKVVPPPDMQNNPMLKHLQDHAASNPLRYNIDAKRD
jgi:succinate dehydrogenase assembly factor 2